MINRYLLRIKVIQILYAYYKGEDQDYGKAVAELKESIKKTYDLYYYLLLLVPSITEYAKQKCEEGKEHSMDMAESLSIDRKNNNFTANKIAEQLSNNKALQKYVRENELSWSDRTETAIKNLYEEIAATDVFAEYSAKEATTYAEDKELWKYIFKNVFAYSELLGKELEDEQLYWNAEEETVFDFALKTIKKLNEDSGSDYPMQPMYGDEDSKEFGFTLFKNAVFNSKEYNALIDKYINTKKWDLSRIATMDRLIMQTAVSELSAFPTIPVNVTLNEYIEITKQFSGEKSGAFINGVLDSVVDDMRKNNKLMKVAEYTK